MKRAIGRSSPPTGSRRTAPAIARRTTSISICANAAPMQRRTPPPNGIQA